MSHTPGPWTLTAEGESVHDVHGFIAHIKGRTVDELRANARLIAAAPKLLAALKAWLTATMFIVSKGNQPALEALYKQSEAALDAAEGRTG